MIVFGLLIAFFFLDYVRPTSFFPGLAVLHLNALVPLAMVVGTIALRKDRQPIDGEPSNHWMIAAFLGSIWFSAVVAPVTERVFTVFEAVLGYGAVYWALTQQVDSLNRLKQVIKTLLIVHVIVAGLNPQMFTDSGTRQYLSSGGFLGDGNDFALSLNIVVPLCLFLVSESTNSRQRIFWATALTVCLASIVLTQSRGGTLALACVGLYYWSKSDKKTWGVVAGILVVGVIVLSAPASYFDRMATIGDTQEGSAQGRIDAWGAAFDMALTYPVTGVGAGHFGLIHGKTAHSIYFLVLGELGFPGLIILITIIARNLTANRRVRSELGDDPSAGTERRLLAALSASMIAFATAGAFLSAAYYPHLYVIAGLSTAARRLVHERARSAAPTEPRPSAVVLPNAISPEWNSARAANPLRLPHPTSPSE